MALEAKKAEADMTQKQQAAQLDQQTEREEAALTNRRSSARRRKTRWRSSNSRPRRKRNWRRQGRSRRRSSSRCSRSSMQWTFGEGDDDVTQRAMHYRHGLELDRRRESERSKADEHRASRSDEAMAALINAIWHSHVGLMQAVSKPRKAVIHRDPNTGKVIGASSVTED